MENPYGDMKERKNLGIHVGERQRDRIGASIRGEIQDWISLVALGSHWRWREMIGGCIRRNRRRAIGLEKLCGER